MILQAASFFFDCSACTDDDPVEKSWSMSKIFHQISLSIGGKLKKGGNKTYKNGTVGIKLASCVPIVSWSIN